MSDSEISIRQATKEDFQGIIDITKGEDLWIGLDYIPFALKNWLLEAEKENSKRDNIVFTLNDEIIGFESFYFMNNNKTVARFGFRVKQSLRGKGYGRQMLVLQLDYLRENFKHSEFTISAIPDINLPDSAFNEKKFGQRLTRCVALSLNVNLNQYKIPNTIGKDEMAKFKMATLSKIQFRGLLQNGRLTQLCPNQCLHMNWVPILPQTEEDIEFAVRKKATVVVDDLENPTSFSVLTDPFPCPAGYRTSIDIFGSEDEQITNHLSQQLWNCFMIENEATKNKSDFLRIQIYFQENQLAAALEAVKMFGLESTQKLVSPPEFNRTSDHMYIYKDRLFK